MNLLLVGKENHHAILETISGLSGYFLLIDAGNVIDEFILRTRRKYTEFDVSKHSFNLFARLTERKTEDVVATLDALSPGGAGTLTKQNALHLIFKTLVEQKPKNLDDLYTYLLPSNPKDTDFKDAAQKVEKLLLRRVLKNVLVGTPNFDVRGIVLARLDPAVLGVFTARALTYFLIAQYKGQVVITNLGLYATEHLASLIHEGRLIAGVRYLDEPKGLQDLVLLMEMDGRKANHGDAVLMAEFEGLLPDPNRLENDYNKRIKRLMD